MNTRKIVSLTMLSSFLVLAACGGNGNDNSNSGASASPSAGASSSASASQPAKKVELRMAWWGSEERHEKTLKAIELFEQNNPGITITGEYSGFDGYFDKLNTQIAAGNAPDLIQMGGNIKEYAGKNSLLDLKPYIGQTINLDDFTPSLVREATVDDKVYGVTLGVSSSALLYNASMFNKAGVAVPTEKWTYDDFKTIVQQIADKLGDGYYGSYDLSSDSATLASYLGSVGKELYRDGAIHFDKQDMVNWFTLWSDLRKSGAVVPAETQVANPPTAVDKSLIVQGKVAIQSASASQISGFQALTQDQLGLITFPNGTAGSGMVPPISGQFITAYSGTKHSEEVAKFMDFLVNDPEAGAILGSTRGVPPSAKIRDSLAASTTATDKVLYDYISLVSEVAPDVDYQQFPVDTEFTKLLQLTSEKISFDVASIDSAVDEFMSEVNKLLAKAQ
ncbi:ABC transporter substrate-binding protein [Cohnella fermenti]|nr:extracellular solute-binding protein [Cohnella fermenti]